MEKSNCLGNFVRYSTLNIMGMIGVSFYILADTYFVSKALGTNGLAALNLALPLYNFMDGCGLMAGMGGGTKYSIQKSMKEDSAANRIFTNAVFFVTGMSVIFMLTGIFLSGTILSVFGARGNILAISATYLRTLLLFSPAFLMNYMLLAFVRNDGAPQLSMAAMIAGSVSNVVLDWVFMFPCRMGIFGAALATGLAPAISMAVLSLHFFRRKNSFHLKKCRPEGKLFLGIFFTGIPSLITEMSSGIVIIVFNSIMLNLRGSVGVAAYSVIANLSLVVIAVYTGLAQGVQPLISSNYGVRNYKNIKLLLRYAMTAMLSVSVIIYAVVFFYAPDITAFFNSEQNELLQSIAVDGIKLYFTACPFAGFNIILSVYFTSIEYPVPAHIISVLRGFAVIIPMAFMLSSAAGIVGVWCAFPAAECLVTAAGLVFLSILRRNSKTGGISRV